MGEFDVNDNTTDVVSTLIKINNERIRLDRLCSAIEELAKYGPIKTEAKRGLADENDDKPNDCVRVKNDENNYRTGHCNITEQQEKELLLKIIDIKKIVHKDRIKDRSIISLDKLTENINTLKALLM